METSLESSSPINTKGQKNILFHKKQHQKQDIMSQGIISGSQEICHYCCSNPNFQVSKSMLEPSSCYLSLNKTTHFLIQPSFSLKYRTGSFSFSRRSQSRACIVNSLYVTAENFYDLLGISESGSLSEIKQAYKQLVRKYHPDVSPPERIEEYTQRFIQVQEAYETLSDPKSRALYDTDMAKGFNLAFSVGNRYRHVKQDLNENRAWKIRWQAQLTELERRSMNKKNCKEKMSWAARIRMQAKG